LCALWANGVGDAVDELGDILRYLEPTLGALGGTPVPLDGGITNRNFRVELGTGEYVVRLHGKDTALLGISREAERIASEAAAVLGLAPTVSAAFDGGLVTQYVRCSSLDSAEIVERVKEIALALRAFHDAGALLPVEFHVTKLLGDYARIVHARGGTLPNTYQQVSAIAARIEGAVPQRTPRPCHNDLLAGNLILSGADGRVMIVDWEYAGMGNSCFDLGNLSVNNGFDEAADKRLLQNYYGAAPSDAQLAELKLMRVLSDVREAAWGVMQSHVSELDFDFDNYADLHFARLQQAAGSADFGDWLEAAGGR
jgi:thiamine kinase-like enzyme